MSIIADPVSSHSKIISEQDERGWDRGAWLTLVVAILMILWPTAMSLASFRYPVDGWMSAPAGSSFSTGGPYRLIDNLSGQPSDLQSGDVVTAIDGHPLLPNALPPLPANLQSGQTLSYTIERNGQPMTIDVTLLTLNASALGRAMLRQPLSYLQTLVMFGLGLFAFLARPGNHGARYLLLAFSQTIGSSMNTASYSLYRTSFPPALYFSADFSSVSWAWFFFTSLTLFVLVYPVRQWPLRRFPHFLPGLIYTTFIILAAIPIAQTVITRIPSGEVLSSFGLILLIAMFVLATIGSLIYNRYRVHDPVVRAQMRWLALGFGVGIALPVLIITIGDFLFADSSLFQAFESLSSFSITLLAVSLVIGILRYRLFDIDVIIRRTTSYAIITGLLALVYFGSIIVLQRILSPLTGTSDVAVVLSTLLIAALFLPIRRRVQDVIDRRFNRKRYNAEKTIEAFAATVRNETDLEALTAELLRVIQETMEPESLSIWLRDPAKDKPGVINQFE